MYLPLATFVDIVHALAMLVWGLGLPFLFWHRWPRLTRAYLWYVVGFVVLSQGSHWLFGECLLTYWARELRLLAGVSPTAEPFTVQLVNFVAGIRPTTPAAVLAWEAAMVISAAGILWSMHRTLRSASRAKPQTLRRRSWTWFTTRSSPR